MHVGWVMGEIVTSYSVYPVKIYEGHPLSCWLLPKPGRSKYLFLFALVGWVTLNIGNNSIKTMMQASYVVFSYYARQEVASWFLLLQLAS